MISLRRATPDDAQTLSDLYVHFAERSPAYFDRCMKEGFPVFIAGFDGVNAGFAVLNTASRYDLFQRLGIFEIQDLNVIPGMRQRGIASALITACEEEARAQGCDQIGLAVALNQSYGPAQRLYAKHGYVPDGAGAMYDHAAPDAKLRYKLDDELCLMMVKTL
jgi:ribosomal protein S18 acetylase RimI-like enzyme